MSNNNPATRPTMQWVSVRDAGGRSRLTAVWTTATAARGSQAA